ncbi:ABC transporter substrate-binding protein [Alicyclobacillaceae bacterium I2511]|nr:ABC transporter substrate-binding protein [Alicyclobacillaceae bacterium I2511]
MMKKRVKTSLLLATSPVLTAMVLSGCGTQTSAPTSTPAQLPVSGIATSTLVSHAKSEGEVVGFGMPSNWANYGGMWKNFSTKYGLKTLYVAEGNMSSAQELQAFQSEKAHPIGDVGDIGISFGPEAVKMGVLAPYKNQYWNQIPSNLKDANGYWATAYYGVISFVVNPAKVKTIPTTWQDLLNPQYKGLIGVDDPRASAEAFDAVVAAAYAFGGSAQNIQPGINFFAKLHQDGNWTGALGDPSELQSGQAAIEITWNYLGQSDAQTFNGNPPVKVVVPTNSTVAGPYVEVINQSAPHPYAARLLNNYLFSDAGQISYAEGGAFPVRLSYIHLPSSVHLPKINMSAVHFLTGDLSAQQKLVNTEWGPEVLKS